MLSVLYFIDQYLISLLIWIIIGSVILSWLIAFNVVNSRNPIVSQIEEFLYRVTEPALRPIRRILPNLGGIDISPIILVLLLFFLRNLMFELFAALV